MNAPIVRLFVLLVVLFSLLVGFTSRWTVFESQALRDKPSNRRALLEEARIKRGLIKARDGSVIARSVPAQGGTFRRVYPQAGLFGHAIGYSFTNLGRAGLERSRNDPLTGQRSDITTVVDQLRGRSRIGNDLTTTLDPRGQRSAYDGLAGRPGAIVALEPNTGKVRVMASLPQFDPNQVDTEFPRLSRQEGSPIFNRATQSTYAPGSTFKVVTAIAALDTGRYQPSSVVDGRSPKPISGVPLTNSGGQSFGPIDLTTALTNSVNTVWAEVAENLGKATMARYMTRLGFYAKPPLDYPASQRAASGEYASGKLLSPLSDRIDVGRMGIGQDKLSVNPLQMAMVAAAVANDGKLMKPQLTDKVIDQDGRTVDSFTPEPLSRVMSHEAADKLAEMMSSVVREGTGTAAALQGINVAGKTGTAEKDPSRNINQPWFIAFAPLDKPRIAIAATIETTVGGQGGTVAAPVAKQVMETLLNE